MRKGKEEYGGERSEDGGRKIKYLKNHLFYYYIPISSSISLLLYLSFPHPLYPPLSRQDFTMGPSLVYNLQYSCLILHMDRITVSGCHAQLLSIF